MCYIKYNWLKMRFYTIKFFNINLRKIEYDINLRKSKFERSSGTSLRRTHFL